MKDLLSRSPTVVDIDGKDICTSESFHSTFATAFAFPDYYGRNMDAWIDCMGDIAPANGTPITIHLKNVGFLKANARQQFDDFIECAAFVNWRQIVDGRPSSIAIAFYE